MRPGDRPHRRLASDRGPLQVRGLRRRRSPIPLRSNYPQVMTSDAVISRGIVVGDTGALNRWLQRDYPVASFVARAVVEGSRAGIVVGTAWDGLVSEIMSGHEALPLRAALLGRIVNNEVRED